MQLIPSAVSFKPLTGIIALLLGFSLVSGQTEVLAPVSDIFFLDLGIVIEPITGKEKYSRLVESPSQEVKFRINKVESGEVYMATSKEMIGTLDRINLRIASLEQSFHAEMDRLQRENEELRGILVDMKSARNISPAQPSQNLALADKPNQNQKIPAPPSREPEISAEPENNIPETAEVIEEPEPVVQKFDQAEYMAGVFAYQREDFIAALKHFDRLLLNSVSQRTKANILYWMADSHQRLSDSEEALKILDQVLDLGQTDRRDDALIQKGLLYRKRGQEDQALLAFETLVQEYPASEYVKLARMELKKAEMVP